MPARQRDQPAESGLLSGPGIHDLVLFGTNWRRHVDRGLAVPGDARHLRADVADEGPAVPGPELAAPRHDPELYRRRDRARVLLAGGLAAHFGNRAVPHLSGRARRRVLFVRESLHVRLQRHAGGGCAKYTTLRLRRGLITTGMFKWVRHPNYLGEILVYGSLAMLAWHWLAALVIAYFWITMFATNMAMKEASMSRYPEWAAYRKRTWWLVPGIF
ncbi:MAG: DUF1295 domain-containing protein [Proteobacteria bacterium]|nr:DUF1295 domain-containing protein [Pseudomonadota bacterium]